MLARTLAVAISRTRIPRPSTIILNSSHTLQNNIRWFAAKSSASQSDSSDYSSGGDDYEDREYGDMEEGELYEFNPDRVKQIDLSFCDIFKDIPAPKVMRDGDYPDWLWTITQKLPTLEDQHLAHWETFNSEDKKNMFRAHRKKLIKRHNRFQKSLSA